MTKRCFESEEMTLELQVHQNRTKITFKSSCNEIIDLIDLLHYSVILYIIILLYHIMILCYNIKEFINSFYIYYIL